MTYTQDNSNLTQAEIWSELAASSQEGNKACYNRLLSEIAPFIRNYIVGKLANPDWAEDVTQEVLISVHKSLKTYDRARPFKPWLMAIVNFRYTDYLRKHYSSRGDKQTSLDNPDYISAAVTEEAFAGEYKDVEAALATLPEKQRVVFEMMKIQGYTAQEVANEVGMSVSAVKVSAHRTLAKLKEKLG